MPGRGVSTTAAGGPVAGSPETNALIAAGASDVYTLTFTIDASTVIADNSLYDACAAGTPVAGEGLFNATTLTEPGATTTVEVRADLDLPDVSHAKGFVSSTYNLDGTYDVVYDIVVTNAGSGIGTYDLDDVPGFDSDLTILGVTVTGSANFAGG